MNRNESPIANAKESKRNEKKKERKGKGYILFQYKKMKMKKKTTTKTTNMDEKMYIFSTRSSGELKKVSKLNSKSRSVRPILAKWEEGRTKRRVFWKKNCHLLDLILS